MTAAETISIYWRPLAADSLMVPAVHSCDIV